MFQFLSREKKTPKKIYISYNVSISNKYLLVRILYLILQEINDNGKSWFHTGKSVKTVK